MRNKPITAKFADILCPYGFQKCGTQFVKIQNDIVFGIGVDCPPTFVYCTIYIMPLFIPSKLVYYEYGSCINYLTEPPFKLFRRDTSEEEQLKWLQDFDLFLNNVAFPMFRSVSTPRKILEYLANQPNGTNRFMRCPSVQKCRLQMYTKIYLHDFKNIDEDICALRKEIQSSTFYTETIRQSLMDEVTRMERIAAQAVEEIDKYFAETVMNTREICFPKYKSDRGSF